MPISSSPPSNSKLASDRHFSWFHRLRHILLQPLKAENGHLEEDISVSVLVLMAITVIWYLVEVMNYNFVALLCQVTILIMLIYDTLSVTSNNNFGYILINIIMNWFALVVALTIASFQVSVAEICSSRYEFVLKAHHIIAVNTSKPGRLVLAISSIYILYVVGTYLSSANLLYIGLFCIETLYFLEKRSKGQQAQPPAAAIR